MPRRRTHETSAVAKVMDRYVDAIQKASIENLKAIYHPAANFFFYREGKLFGVPIEGLFEMVVGTGKIGSEIQYEVTNINISGKIATAMLDISDLGGNHIIDMFTLSRDGDAWVIASKVSYRPE